jgi:hypothetical protein
MFSRRGSPKLLCQIGMNLRRSPLRRSSSPALTFLGLQYRRPIFPSHQVPAAVDRAMLDG